MADLKSLAAAFVLGSAITGGAAVAVDDIASHVSGMVIGEGIQQGAFTCGDNGCRFTEHHVPVMKPEAVAAGAAIKAWDETAIYPIAAVSALLASAHVRDNTARPPAFMDGLKYTKIDQKADGPYVSVDVVKNPSGQWVPIAKGK